MHKLQDLGSMDDVDSQELEAMWRKAAQRKMSPAERQEQMISFIMGSFSLKSSVKREDVERYIYERYGKVTD